LFVETEQCACWMVDVAAWGLSHASESRRVVGLATGAAATTVGESGALAQQEVERCVVEGLGVLVQPGV
jgi:hypothetical protein